MNKINTLYIRTPEGIVFSQPLAGPMSRFLAWGIDVACILLDRACVATGASRATGRVVDRLGVSPLWG